MPLDSTDCSMHCVSSLPPMGALAIDFCSTYPSCTADTALKANTASV